MHQRLTPIALAALLTAAPSGFGQDSHPWSAGVAKVDITPGYAVRLSGFGFRRTESEGVTQKIWAKALALQWQDGPPAVVIAVDNLGIPAYMRDELARRLKQKARLEPDRLAITASHTHTAPMLTNVAPNLFSMPIPREHQANIDRYTKELADNLEKVALAALGDRQPARLAYGVGTAKFAMNRRTKGGPVDHDLPLLAVYGKDDKLRALHVTYACHCVTLSNNKLSGDWAGYAQEILEENHPGAVALVSIGCGADQNPTSGVTGDKVDICRAQGAEIAAEVRRLLGGFLAPVRGALNIKMKKFELPLADLPTKEQWQAKAKQKGPIAYHAAVNLARLERGEKLRDHVDYSVQAWTFGDDLAMVFLPGEVVVDYALRLKKELDGRRLWINAYANDAPCYIPSERVLKEGGYEGGFAMVYYDVTMPFRPGLEQKIVDAARELVGPKFASPIDAKKCDTLPLSPQQSLATLQVRKGLKVELVVAEPLVVDPVAIDFGPDGKLWVAEMYDYPLGLKGNYEPGGRIKLLRKSTRVQKASAHNRSPSPPPGNEVTPRDDRAGGGEGLGVRGLPSAGDVPPHPQPLSSRRDDPASGFVHAGGGRRGPDAATTVNEYDHATIFLDNIPFPTGVMAYKKGVLVCAAPDILYAEDTDGDGKADLVKRLFSGFGTGNYQGRVNSLQWGLDGWIYGSCGLFGGDITSHTGKVVKLGDRDFRIKPEEGVIEPATGRTQQGRVRDDWDNWFGCDNSTLLRHYPLADHYLRRNPHVPVTDTAVYVPDYPDSNRLFPIGKQQLFKLSGQGGRATAACGLGIYRDDWLGKDFQGNAFICEPVSMVVHRMPMAPKGSTFSSLRAADEQTVEFLAGSDPWFRPVQAITGPDGALWIVDMYRYVIEHPRWIPPEELVKHDLRAGSTMGRLYRVVPDAPSRGMNEVNPAGLPTPRLVDALESPNGWLRDQASQLLLRRQDPAAAPLLEKQLTSAEPLARLHSLCVLDLLGKLQPQQVERALADAHPGVRRHAVRLAERFLDHPVIIAALTKREGDADPQVRLQLACTLGEWRDPKAAALLADLALAKSADNHLMAAVLSSLNEHNLPLLAARTFATPGAPALFVQRLARHIAAQPDRKLFTATLTALLPEKGDPTPAQLHAIAALWETGAKHMRQLSLDPVLQAKLNSVLKHVRAHAVDDKRDEAQRRAALQLLGRSAARADDDIKILRQLLAPQHPAAVQAAALQAMGRLATTAATVPIIDAWKSLTPGVKAQALDLLLAREAWQVRLLEAVRDKKIGPGDLDATRRQRLLKSKHEKVAALAAELFAGPPASDRHKVIAQYQTALQPGGDTAKGHELFRKHCLACHRLGDEGHQVGPDMTVALGKPRQFLLIEILDPSRNLDSRYLEYHAADAAGRSFVGVLAAETSTSITLRGQEGKQHVLLRSDLDSLTSTGRSLMPDGFEKEIPPAAMADLLAFLSNPPAAAAPPKQFAGNKPEVVTLRDGRLELLATTAEIHGGDIAFEGEPFQNIGFWHGPNDRAVWRVRLDKPARFDVWLDWACARSSAGNTFVFESDVAPLLRGKITATGDDWSVYRQAKIGTIQLEAGVHRLTLRPEKAPHGALMDLRGIVLVAEGQKPPAAGSNRRREPPGGSAAEVAKALLDDSIPSAKRQALVAANLPRAAELLQVLTANLRPGTKEEYRRIPWIWRVAIGAGRKNEAGQLRRLLDAALPKQGEPLHDWQAVVIGGGIINGVSLAGAWPGRRVEEILKDQPELTARWLASLAQAHAMADDAKVPSGTRYDALRMVALDTWDKARPRLIRHLPKDAHGELQMGAVSGLADIEQPDAATLLVEHLAGFMPDNRKLALDGLVKTDKRAALLLQALATGRAQPAWLTKTQRQALLDSPNPDIKSRAAKVLTP